MSQKKEVWTERIFKTVTGLVIGYALALINMNWQRGDEQKRTAHQDSMDRARSWHQDSLDRNRRIEQDQKDRSETQHKDSLEKVNRDFQFATMEKQLSKQNEYFAKNTKKLGMLNECRDAYNIFSDLRAFWDLGFHTPIRMTLEDYHKKKRQLEFLFSPGSYVLWSGSELEIPVRFFLLTADEYERCVMEKLNDNDTVSWITPRTTKHEIKYELSRHWLEAEAAFQKKLIDLTQSF